MKTLIIAMLAAASASAQSSPVTKGPLTVQTVIRHPAQEAIFMPIPAPDLGIDIFQVFVATSTTATSRFRVTITVKDGNTETRMTQETARNPIMMSLAQFKVPLGAILVSTRVAEISSPLDFP